MALAIPRSRPAPSAPGNGAAIPWFWQSRAAAFFAWLRASPGRSVLLVEAFCLVAVVIANTVTQVWLNRWNGDFYAAIEQRQFSVFLHQLLVFLVIAGILLVLVVAQTWLHRILEIRLRQLVTLQMFAGWLAPAHAYRLTLAGEIGVNPDQRIQEDTRHLADLSTDLGVGLLQSSLLLVTFAGVLWTLSNTVAFTVDGMHIVIPGFMLWAALAYALAGSLATWLVGRPLIRINAERYAREAEFRAAVVRIGEYGEEIALHRGEAYERRTLDAVFGGVVDISRSLVNALARVTWVTSGYGWLAIVAPIVVAAPAYFGGNLTFGGLMMVVHAFFQVQQSLRWFVDNFPRIADWRATYDRVTKFRNALASLGRDDQAGESINLEPSRDGRLTIANLAVRGPEGMVALDQRQIEIEPGSRVLIVDDARIGTTVLLRAIAGLWPWGRGTIRVPDDPSVAFMTQRPHLPMGTLANVISYPLSLDDCLGGCVHAALDRVELGRLSDQLERHARWDKELNLDEQQRLAFARLLVQAPSWVFLHEATSALSAEAERCMLSIFENELPDTTVVTLARQVPTTDFYQRVIRLQRVDVGRPGAGLAVTVPGATERRSPPGRTSPSEPAPSLSAG